MPATSADAVLAAARAGDAAALDALLREHQPRIYRFGLHMCRDPEDAKDVLQDTLLAAARSLSGFRGASAAGWGEAASWTARALAARPAIAAATT